MKVDNAEFFLDLYTISMWPVPTNVSQGISDAFSTGSQAQNPPKLNDSYAHAPPINIPVPKIIIPKNVQGKASSCHSPYFFFHKPAIAYANGTMVEAKPRNNVGG